MTVQPEIGLPEQGIERIAKACCSGGDAVARVSAAQARGEVRHDHRYAVKGLAQGRCQPSLAKQRLFTHLLRQHGLAVAGSAGFLR